MQLFNYLGCLFHCIQKVLNKITTHFEKSMKCANGVCSNLFQYCGQLWLALVLMIARGAKGATGIADLVDFVSKVVEIGSNCRETVIDRVNRGSDVSVGVVLACIWY